MDDEAFKRFLKVFEKYQTELKAQPEMWRDINTGVEGMAAAGAAIAAEIAHQADETRRLATEESDREKAKDKARRAEESHAKRLAQLEQEQAKRRQQAIAQVKEYARNVAEAAVGLGKWAVMGGGAGFLGGALSLWGLDRLVGGVGEQRRSAQGLGVSMGAQQGMGVNMQRYFDVNSVMESVANAQATPSEWSTFRMMGVNPKGKDPAQLTGEMALAARRMFIKDKGNLALAGAQGLTRIFSPDDLRRMAATPEGELRSSIGDSKKFAATAGLRDEVGRKWQNFSIAMETATLKIKNTLIDKLSILERNGSLDKIIAKFGELAVTVLDRIDFSAMADGLDAFGKYIGTPKFQKDVSDFADDIGSLASKIASALRFLGLIPDHKYDTPAGVQAADESNFPKTVGWGKMYSPSITSKAADAQFQKWGWKPHQSAGITANIMAESKFDPFAKGDWNGKNYEAYGLSQWHADRRKNYTALFGHTMESVKDRATALREQMEFVQWELNSKDKRNHYKKAGEALWRSRNAYEAGEVVSKQYERPRDTKGAVAAARGRVAVEVHVKNQTGASVSTTANSAAGG